jgi:hypothetical protein
MTIFGKTIFGAVLLLVGAGVFYGVSSYAHKDTTPEETVSFPIPKDSLLSDASTTDTAATSGDSSTTMATTTPVATATPVSMGKKIPFNQFMKKGGSYICAVTQTMATMTTSGTVYLNNGKVKAEFTVAIAGNTINTSMIIRDGYSYTWTSNSPTKGIKTKIAKLETSNASSSSRGTVTWDGSQIGDYNCEAQTVEDSVFALPTTVTFAEAK